MQLSTTLLRYLWIVKTRKSLLKKWPSLVRDVMRTKILLHLLQKTQTKAKRKGMILMHLLQNNKLRRPQLGRCLTQEKLPLAPLSKRLPLSLNSMLKPVPKEERPKTPKPNWVVPPNDLPKTRSNWANEITITYKYPDENKLIRKTRDMGSFIKCISLQFQMEECHLLLTDQIDLVNRKGNRVVPNVSKPLPIGGPPDFGLEELVPSLWIKSECEYDISAAYDYTIVQKPSVVIYRDRNNQKKMMRESEVHKFSDRTLTRILEKLDHMVKDYVLFKFNPSIEHRIWLRMIKGGVKSLLSGDGNPAGANIKHALVGTGVSHTYPVQDLFLRDAYRLMPRKTIRPQPSLPPPTLAYTAQWVSASPSPLSSQPLSPSSRPSRKRCRSPTPPPTIISLPSSHMLPPRKRFRYAPAVSSQKDTLAKAMVGDVTRECGGDKDDIETLQARLTSIETELMTHCGRVKELLDS
uniref:Uncharacterized protein n=1 Tax=Tanacetum cinerariifolium TaxID=118510 RepID=A0A6L2M366_TANCI|nr:hypothetical protein [Tanacetum cinerariifolium]